VLLSCDDQISYTPTAWTKGAKHLRYRKTYCSDKSTVHVHANKLYYHVNKWMYRKKKILAYRISLSHTQTHYTRRQSCELDLFNVGIYTKDVLLKQINLGMQDSYKYPIHTQTRTLER